MPRTGSLVGEYRLEKEIGAGGFGKVYRAQSVRTGRVVALKLVSLNNDDHVAAERLGALLQRRFEHIHGMVPEVFDMGEDEHYFYIAMEFLKAPTLSALAHCRRLDPADAARHAMGICRFLEKAHSFETEIDGSRFPRIIHGDLKPANVFVLDDGTIKVLDFGIAKALEKNRRAKTIKFVTPPYASPQRLETRRGSEQDDCWAVGVMLYEMISGRRPHSQIEDPPYFAELSAAIRRNDRREPLPPSCPIELVAIIDKLLNMREELRYESAAAIRRDLEAFLRDERPAALKQFETPETLKIAPPTQPQPPTAVPPQSTAPVPVPTLPFSPPAMSVELPRGGGAPDFSHVVGTAAPVVRRAAVVHRSVWLASLLAFTTVFTLEAVAWLGAERIRAELPALELRSVAAKRQQYDRLLRWSPFHVGPRLRLDEPLAQRLVGAADAVLADYRQEEPTVAEAQWRQASDALHWASQLVPDAASIVPKALNCRGHVDRIAAQSQARTNPAESQRLYTRAIDEFQRAAQLDPRSPDPYLGLSRIYIYGLNKDVDRGAAAIHEAEVRGHTPGWRERAQLGDGYMRRADATRQKARRLTDEPRRTALESARDDYDRCVESFTPILDKGRSKYNGDYCQRHLDALTTELAGDPVERP